MPRKKSTTPVAEASPAEGGDVNNVDKIRDILFGNQIREFDDKFSQLEQRMSAEIAGLRQENALQIDSLKTFVESEIEILTSKLAGEEKSRINELDNLESELKKVGRQMDEKISDVGASLDAQSRDINQKLLKQSQDFNAEVTNQTDITRKRMDDYKRELTNSKVDRSVLAEMLNTLALQINAETPE